MADIEAEILRNIKFLPCFNIIDRYKDIEVYRFLESLVYGESNEIEELKKELEDIGVEKFVKNLQARFHKPNEKQKKAIKVILFNKQNGF